MENALVRARGAPVLESIAGALILAVGMGFGRFSFTGMYPLMVKEAAMTVSGGSLAASANYAGYLLGALAVSRIDHRHAVRLCQFATIGTVVCLATLALHPSIALIIGARFIAGAMSALALVAVSVWLFHVVGHHHGAPILYSGVGTGIAISAELIAFGHAGGLWTAALWLLLAAASAILSAIAWPAVARNVRSYSEGDEGAGGASSTNDAVIAPRALIAIYGLAGLGYIVTATYLPLLVRNALPQVNPVHIWAAFGLAAVPSCFLWHWLHHRWGSRTTLAANLAVQAAGVILPVLDHSAFAFLGSAVLVGGTFVGTVTVVMPAAKRVAHAVKFNLMATLTAAYGLGQIVGPLLSDRLVAHTHSFDQPLVVAAVALFVAAAVSCGRGRA
ncbi:putative MFS family arabinose efflux permease [Trinickia symbiotica]|uniref:MFS transporter n=2 Tax=Trinickia symbiotica TaxID=863227 RepID=A0A2N7X9K4_9BURK|nr:MFS transporter [Trinickia symbiotica]PPK47210.1 putative MFS family arabinose efflux permease [Trinickia symbiotica]